MQNLKLIPATRKVETAPEDARESAGQALLERWTVAKERLARVAVYDAPWIGRERVRQ